MNNKNIEDLSDSEVINFIKDSLIFLKKDFNIKNFFLELKKNGYSALKHMAFVAPFVSKKYKNQNSKDQDFIKKIVQLELADVLFRQGATSEEVTKQTNISKEIMAALMRGYYQELPKPILMYKLMQFRLFELIQLNKLFLEQYVLPELSGNRKSLANAALSTIMDMVLANVEDKAALDRLANEIK